MKNKIIALWTLFIVGQLAMAEQPINVQSQNEQFVKLEAKIETLIVNDKNYSAALLEYANAAKANPQEVYYRQQYAILQRVTKMQTLLVTETNPEKWKSYAKAIRGYFYSKGYISEALSIDLDAANKFNTGEYAANVLETLLLTGKNKDAAKFAEDKKSVDKTIRYQTLSLLAEAYNGRSKEAVESLQTIKIDPKTDYKSFFDFARIYNISNNKEKTLSNLQLFLENTPPSEITSARDTVTRIVEFSHLRDSDGYKKVLATESKVQQSSCTGGANCNSCSLKTKCPSNAK